MGRPKVEYIVDKCRYIGFDDGGWIVEGVDATAPGNNFLAVFNGPDAEYRAEQYRCMLTMLANRTIKRANRAGDLEQDVSQSESTELI